MKHLLFRLPVLIPLIATAALASAHLANAGTVRIEGRLREKGTRRPLKDVNIYYIPLAAEAAPGDAAPAETGKPLKTTSDRDGRFVIENAPEGRFKWIVNLAGYDRLERPDDQPPGAPQPIPPRELYLEKSTYLGVYETTIYDKAKKRDDKTKSISGADISKLAGASNDPIKAVQNLPGVNRSSGFSSQVVIEGSSPNDTLYQVEAHEVPLIFHFGGLTTIVPPESVDRVDLITSGFGAETGRTTAGGVNVWLKHPRTDRLHGLAFFDLFNLGAMLEGPIGRESRFYLAARQSYIGLVLKAALSGNKDFDLTVAPDFRDLTGIYETELTPIDSFRLVTLGSMDSLNFIFKEPVKANPAIRGEFSTATNFFRLIPQFTHRHSQRTTTRVSFGLGKDWIRFDTSDNFFHLKTWALTTRAELEREMSPYWRTYVGIDNSFNWADVEFALPKIYSAGGVSTPFSVAQTVTASVTQATSELAAYWRNDVRLGDTPWMLVPALRVERYSQTGETIPEPRLQIRYQLTEALQLRAAGGLYGIAPQPQETSPAYGNPSLKTPLATHFALGAAQDFRKGGSRGWDFTGDVFYKHFYRLVIPSTELVTSADGTLTRENYSNRGHGRAFGFEAQAKYAYGPLSGWITYTLSRSTRWNPSAAEAVAGFDQTHNLAVVGSIEGKNNWQLSLRARLVTGNPYTPIVASLLDADNDIYVPIAGSFYSERQNIFWQLDMRLDKKWIFDSWILSAYLDVQNVTNHGNVEAIRYSYDYSQTTQVEGLPILPILGLKGEF